MEQTKGLPNGISDFKVLREKNYYYVDKTAFIEELQQEIGKTILFTRPRRFGKTLNMSMLQYFWDIQNTEENRKLFQGLEIENSSYMAEQGKYPVIYLSFKDMKADSFSTMLHSIQYSISILFNEFSFLAENLKNFDALQFKKLLLGEANIVELQNSIKFLSKILTQYYNTKTVILLDEYDTPMQEAYVHGYWEQFTAFIRSLFNASFKTNPYLERALMTGVTRVSKESIFSDLNNLRVITTTSDLYADCFGFTEKEVFDALDNYGMGDKKEIVKQWYDGFTFGQYHDIYNPWSITNYLKEKKLYPYWASTSSNGLVSNLIQAASADIKEKMEDLLNGKEILVTFDEQIVFDQLDQDENAIWSLMLASGYLNVNDVEYRGTLLEPWYRLCITNLETKSMFSGMFRGWFKASHANYNGFVKALLQGSLKEMNIYMNDVALATFSTFDTGKQPSKKSEPERFYHGFVLGLLVELRERYEIKSNRESGYGRYDVMLVPLNESDTAIVIEFKVQDHETEKTLQDTVQMALRQIEDKNYDADLIALGIGSDRIRHYGFAFEGKKVLIG